jgi:hypothetical protein
MTRFSASRTYFCPNQCCRIDQDTVSVPVERLNSFPLHLTSLQEGTCVIFVIVKNKWTYNLRVSCKQLNFQIVSTIIADHSVLAFQGKKCLRPRKHSDRELESYSRHRCLSAFLLLYVWVLCRHQPCMITYLQSLRKLVRTFRQY